MISIVLYILTVLSLVAAAVLLYRSARLNAELLATQADRDRLAHCIDHNIRGIRAHIGYAYPEAVKVCDYIERTIPSRSRLEFAELEKALGILRRAHNAAILEFAQSGEPYRSALAELLCLLREKDSAWFGRWEQLEKYDDILAAPRSAAVPDTMPWARNGLHAEGKATS